jgi:hypothetical protein
MQNHKIPHNEVALRLSIVLACTIACLAADARSAEPHEYGVLVYGATPGGIAAALAAADDGETVLLVEPTACIGGMVTSGLSHTDYHAFEGVTGTFLDFAKRVEAYYATTYGRDSQQVKDSFRGTFGEPHVNLAVFRAMVAERKTIHLKTETRLVDVKLRKTGDTSTIESATFMSTDNPGWIGTAAVFIDGSYEGDLMAKAGVTWKVGREGEGEYGESLAPETADGQLQAYNFRFIMTKDAKNLIAPKAPAGYKREDFLPVVAVLESGKIKTIFGYPSDCLFKAQTPPLPNGKYDINDVSLALVRLSLPGKNLGWPDGDAEIRQGIFDEHLRDQVGLLYFLQNDEAVPKQFRDEARTWGWCRDEFPETGHLPPLLYVREARRMVGSHIFIQADSEPAKGDARAVLHPDAIAMGEYGNNCHGTAHEGPRFGGNHTGEFYHVGPPYQIPYGVIVPLKVENLLVPVAVSSSHVGFCALRLEAIWASLGQAAGHAAHLARAARVPVQRVTVKQVQDRLHRTGAATIYVSDVLPGHPDFAAVQAWGAKGGLHGLAAPPKGSPRGKTIHGQYSETYPNHEVQLDKVLDAELAERWLELAEKVGLPIEKLPKADGKLTRGDWVRAAARAE